MQADTAVIVADSHLADHREPAAVAFHRFLAEVPNLGGHLIINGDLFEFWFEYRHVIPRRAFKTLAALEGLAGRGVRLTVVGGNHDRWGGPFWARELGAAFHPDGAELEVAGWQTLIRHGDGLAEQHWGAKLLHRVTRNRIAVGAFRLIHPDLSFWMVERSSRALADQTRDAAVLDRAARAQDEFARSTLRERPELDLIVLGHTHRPVLEECQERRWFLNPGAWMDGYRYALVTPEGPSLHRWETAGEP